MPQNRLHETDPALSLSTRSLSRQRKPTVCPPTQLQNQLPVSTSASRCSAKRNANSPLHLGFKRRRQASSASTPGSRAIVALTRVAAWAQPFTPHSGSSVASQSPGRRPTRGPTRGPHPCTQCTHAYVRNADRVVSFSHPLKNKRLALLHVALLRTETTEKNEHFSLSLLPTVAGLGERIPPSGSNMETLGGPSAATQYKTTRQKKKKNFTPYYKPTELSTFAFIAAPLCCSCVLVQV